MSVIKSNIWPPLLYIILNFDAWWPPNFMIPIHVFVFKSQQHIYMYFNLKKYNIPQELSSVRQFFDKIYINWCQLNAMLNAMYFKKSMESPYACVLFWFLIIRLFCMQEIRKIKSKTQLHSYLLEGQKN